MREYLRDAAGTLHGWIDRGGDRDVARDSRGHVVGYYDCHRNQSRDANHHLLGSGDLLAGLIYQVK